MDLKLLAIVFLAQFLLTATEPNGPKVEGLITIPRATRESQWPKVRPSVLVALLCRNKAHLLKNFLGYIEELDYPKERMNIW